MLEPDPLDDWQKLLDDDGDAEREDDGLIVCVTVGVPVRQSVAVGLTVDEIDGLLEDDLEIDGDVVGVPERL